MLKASAIASTVPTYPVRPEFVPRKQRAVILVHW